MADIEIPQLTYAQEMGVAFAGQKSDSGRADHISRLLTVACNPGILLSGDEDEAAPPTTADEVGLTFHGVVRRSQFKEPSSPQYAVGDCPSIMRQGRIWVTLLAGAAPAAHDPCFVYYGATAANRGQFTEDSEAGSVAALPGAKFTGRVESGIAEVELNAVQDANTTSQVFMRTVTIGFADIQTAGLTNTVNIGAALPANAYVIGREIDRTTAFSGGAITDVDLEIGIAGNADAIVASTAVDTGTGTSIKGVDGDNPNGSYGSAQLVATFTATAANLSELTAGACTIRVQYAIIP